MKTDDSMGFNAVLENIDRHRKERNSQLSSSAKEYLSRLETIDDDVILENYLDSAKNALNAVKKTQLKTIQNQYDYEKCVEIGDIILHSTDIPDRVSLADIKELLIYNAQYMVDATKNRLNNLKFKNGLFNFENDGSQLALNFAQTLDKKNEPEKLTLNEYLGQQGLASPMSDYMLDKLRLPKGETERQEKRRLKEANKVADEYQEKRAAAIGEYRQKVESGEIQNKTSLEIRLETANGNPDNESTQAARRRLEKQGIDWKTGQPIIETVQKTGYVQGVCESVAAIGDDHALGKKLLTEMNVTKDLAKKYANPKTYKTLEQGIFAPQQKLEPTHSRKL